MESGYSCGRPAQALGLAAFVFLWEKREDDLLEAGIEGVALNPNSK